MARLYERFLRILKDWPLNPEYPEPVRGLPEHLRKQGKLVFSARGEFTGDSQKCERNLSSLERLSKNHWSNAYSCKEQTGALGMTSEQCRFALTEDFEKALNSSKFTLLIGQVVELFRKGKGEGKA